MRRRLIHRVPTRRAIGAIRPYESARPVAIAACMAPAWVQKACTVALAACLLSASLPQAARGATAPASAGVATSLSNSNSNSDSANTAPLSVASAPAWATAASSSGATAATATSAVSAASGASEVDAASDRNHVTLTFTQLGAPRVMSIHGPGEEAGAEMQLRTDQLVNTAVLHLVYRFSSAALAHASALRVDVNGERVASVPLAREQVGQLLQRDVPLNGSVFVESNRIAVRLDSPAVASCETYDRNANVDVAVDGASAIEYHASQIAVPNDVSRLPMPFFDHNDVRRLRLPVVFAGRPDTHALEAAGIVASWFGSLASYRGAQFPVTWDSLPASGDAVLFVTNGTPRASLASLHLTDVDGPRVTLMTDPSDANGKFLVIQGRDLADLKTAAVALALGQIDAQGRAVLHNGTLQVDARVPYDAPRWVPSHHPASLHDIDADGVLSVTGHNPDLIRVPLRLPPDVFAWGQRGIPMDLRWRYASRPYLSRSTLDISVNDDHLETLIMPRSVVRLVNDALSAISGSDDAGAQSAMPSRLDTRDTIYLPVDRLRSNAELRFQYRYAFASGESCVNDGASGVGGDIDPSSTIDLTQFPHYLKLPDLAAFANSGFPFTRLADLSQTAVVLPTEASPDEIGLYLDTMGRMGASTGYPVAGVQVATTDSIDGASNSTDGRDLLFIGTFGDQPLVARWIRSLGVLSAVPVERDAPRLAVFSDALEWLRTRLSGGVRTSRADMDELDTDSFSVIAGFEAPGQPGRSVVALMAGRRAAASDLAEAMLDASLIPSVQGGVTLVHGTQVNSYRASHSYAIGSLPWATRMRWLLASQPFGVAGLAFGAVLLLTLLWYGALTRVARRRLNRA